MKSLAGRSRRSQQNSRRSGRAELPRQSDGRAQASGRESAVDRAANQSFDNDLIAKSTKPATNCDAASDESRPVSLFAATATAAGGLKSAWDGERPAAHARRSGLAANANPQEMRSDSAGTRSGRRTDAGYPGERLEKIDRRMDRSDYGIAVPGDVRSFGVVQIVDIPDC